VKDRSGVRIDRPAEKLSPNFDRIEQTSSCGGLNSGG